MSIRDMKIGTRLIGGFGLVLMVLLVVGGVGYWGVDTTSQRTITMLQTDSQVSENASRARANVVGLRRYEKDIFLNLGTDKKENTYRSDWKEQNDHLALRLDELEKVAYLPADKDAVKSMRAEATAYIENFGKVLAMIDAGKLKTPQQANAAMTPFKEIGRAHV